MARFFLSLVISLFFVVSFGQSKSVKDKVQGSSPFLEVTLLGTGDPQPIMGRFGPSILVQAGGQSLLFDVGRGCLQRLHQINLPYDKLDALFLTHLHSDHIVGLPDLWLTGWLISKRSIPLKVFGPSGTNNMVTYFQKAFAFDIKMRTEDDKAPANGSKLLVSEIRQGTVYEKKRC